MLVLTRKVGEAISIGDNIKIIIIKADRNRIRIGIEAPIDIPILRSELRISKPPENPNESGN